MRNYKFRAWHKIDKRFIEKNNWFGISYNGEIIFTDDINYFDINDFIVSQFTGYKDCKDNDIYEGDVIKCWHGSLVVKFETFDDEQGYILPLDDTDMEIIGNIFENPEYDNQLVKKQTDK